MWTGSKPVERAAETINFFKAQGKRIFYVTNNSTKTRSQYLIKLSKLGFKAEEVRHLGSRFKKKFTLSFNLSQSEIATSGYLVASYLQSLNFKKTVYLVGSEGLSEELHTHGIKHTLPGVVIVINYPYIQM